MPEYCYPHLERTGKQVPAEFKVDGTAFCRPCMRGEPINLAKETANFGQDIPIVRERKTPKYSNVPEFNALKLTDAEKAEAAAIKKEKPEPEWKPRVKHLLVDGKWAVPPEERPKGWESWPVGEVVMRKIAEDTREQIKTALLHGMSIRKAAEQFGVASQTCLNIRATLDMSNVKCECGRPAGHKGWCKGMVQKSPALQETMKMLHAPKEKSVVRQTEPVVEALCECGAKLHHRGRHRLAPAVNLGPIVLEPIVPPGAIVTVERSHEITEKRTETVTVQHPEPPVLDVALAKVEPALPAAPVKSYPYIEPDPPEFRQISDVTMDYYGGQHDGEADKEFDLRVEAFFDLIPELAEKVTQHRQAKEITDRILGGWLARNETYTDLLEDWADDEEAMLRFNGELGDLWRTVHATIMGLMEKPKTKE